jgi:multidrug efflux pump subunit AcrA (membrane-fusion protein)
MNRPSFVKWGLALLLLVGGVFFGINYSNKNKIGAGKGQSNLFTVEKMDLEQKVTIAGFIIPEKKTIIAAPFNGYVKKIYVKVGDFVKSGEPLVSIVQSLQSIDPIYPLLAPFSGTVVQVLRSEGEYVKQDDSKFYIMRIDQLDKLVFRSLTPEIDIVKIKIGQVAIIKAKAILDKTYKGKVRKLFLAAREQDDERSPKVEFQSEISIDDPDDQLKSGLSAVVDIVTNKRTKVFAVPHEYIEQNGAKNFVTLESGEKKEITLGMQNESMFEVLKGLTGGEKLRQVDFLKMLEGGEGAIP